MRAYGASIPPYRPAPPFSRFGNQGVAMRLIPVVSLCVAFIGCSGSPTESLIAPTAARVASSDDGGATSSGAPTLTVDQSTLWVSCFNLPASRTVTTTSNFPGTITATVDNPYCSVTASQEATVTPGSGGAKHAT